MRAIVILLSLGRIWACSCIGPGDPSHEAGRSAAVFTGTVVSITNSPVKPFSARDARPEWPRRTVRLRVGEALSGIAQGQSEIEITTGMGDSDCGFPFVAGKDFFVYAYRAPEGKLATSICNRTRPIAQAAEDLKYLRANAGAPETSQLTVKTSYPGFPPKAGLSIAVEGGGKRSVQTTNRAGDAVFENLSPGSYRVHSVADGDLADDPTIELGARGSLDVTLFRILTIHGRLSARKGPPPTRVRVELRSTAGEPWEDAGIGSDGSYQIQLRRPGRYYLGVNLNQSPTADSPYTRWFHPGTTDQSAATVIEFTGKPGVVTYDLTLPDPQPIRMVTGTAFFANGTRGKAVRLNVVDAQGGFIAQAIAEEDGTFQLPLVTEGRYTLHAFMPGGPGEAVSAVPLEIEPKTNTTNLRLVLNQSGNSYLDAVAKLPKSKR